MPDGTVLRIWPVLCCVEGDIPWMQKLTNSIGHGGKRACFRCAQNGVWVFAANTVRYVGSSCRAVAMLPLTTPAYPWHPCQARLRHPLRHGWGAHYCPYQTSAVQLAWVPRPGHPASAGSRCGA